MVQSAEADGNPRWAGLKDSRVTRVGAFLRRTRIDEIPLGEVAELAGIQSTGGFSAAESYAWHRNLLASRANEYDPRVAARIQRGATMMAHEYLDLVAARRRWIECMAQSLRGYDAVLSPTVPLVGPTVASVAPATGMNADQDAAHDTEFFRVNALLLRNTSMVNMLDGCALSLPCPTDGGLPVGLMVWGPAMADDAVLGVSLAIEAALAAHRAGQPAS